MNVIKLSKEETRSLWREELDGYELINEGDWEVDHKWQHITQIVKHLESGKYYSFTLSRSGSPYSDYYYSYEDDGSELLEVKKVTKTVVTETWEVVNE